MFLKVIDTMPLKVTPFDSFWIHCLQQ